MTEFWNSQISSFSDHLTMNHQDFNSEVEHIYSEQGSLSEVTQEAPGEIICLGELFVYFFFKCK